MSTRSCLLGLMALLASAGAPEASRAGTLSLTFDLSTTSLHSPVLPSPPTTAASATVVLTGVDALGGVTGPAGGAVRGLRLAAMSTAQAGPSTLVAVSIMLSQQGTAAGSFDGTNLVLGTGQVGGRFVQSLRCLVGSCGQLSGVSTAIFSNATAPTRLELDGLAMSGAAVLSGSLFARLGVGNIPVTLAISGQEVSRTFEVPEPMAQGALGIAALLLHVSVVAFGLRRARRSP